jgi:hypothetical protein
MPLLGADPVNATYHYLAGNPAALPGMLFSVVIGAGFGEETLFRGYLFERLRKLLDPSVWAKTAIVLFDMCACRFRRRRLGTHLLRRRSVCGTPCLQIESRVAASGRTWG